VQKGAKSRMRRTETPKPIWIQFCMVVDSADIVTYTNFGDHRLRGFWVACGQISPFPIDFDHRPYNTLALPCECVIQHQLPRYSLKSCFYPRYYRGNYTIFLRYRGFPADYRGNIFAAASYSLIQLSFAFLHGGWDAKSTTTYGCGKGQRKYHLCRVAGNTM